MELIQYILIGVFLVATIIGYLLINNVPSRLHTPLMSGMNALSGITILGALISTGLAIKSEVQVVSYIFGSLAIILAMINVAGGFSVTNRMLKMFGKKQDDETTNS
ncbi:MAG TPA: NAD(P) transhydrogenase subunit alpha [Perlabentimonas sp.]|jgi:NAD(P) transhydrogenase subunit alpha|nr:NAD(P) transhydrogenase subunit alpha [Bacteroidales bacterium]MDD4671646.1 NAD(P) transhydrogenase subunit alpha [Bacteroidales bacterium]MDY0349374.1 NAD(P) transhydrogenase subunit alpha [Tenuifilaceae bacterium]HZJ73436.1 NAD(P) transhydrogenase subunit alpha [Perlabentimonas sp.]